ncbi:MAG TPA: hypothetical protein VGX71_13665 [Pseudaminobacter sp.]|nr:hypothetical protein [Pseudaminobacter sp.]
MKDKDARERLARRLVKEFRPTTERGDVVELAHYEADALADIIAEYVSAIVVKR